MEPNHPGGHHKLAEVYADQGDFTLAAAHLSRARRHGYRNNTELEQRVSAGVRAGIGSTE